VFLNAWACNRGRFDQKLLSWPILTLHADPNIWPQNADSFDPTRWLENPDAPLFTYGLGYRSCSGISLANRLLYLFFVRLITAFEIVEAGDVNIDPVRGCKSADDLISSPRDTQLSSSQGARDVRRLRKQLKRESSGWHESGLNKIGARNGAVSLRCILNPPKLWRLTFNSDVNTLMQVYSWAENVRRALSCQFVAWWHDEQCIWDEVCRARYDGLTQHPLLNAALAILGSSAIEDPVIQITKQISCWNSVRLFPLVWLTPIMDTWWTFSPISCRLTENFVWLTGSSLERSSELRPFSTLVGLLSLRASNRTWSNSLGLMLLRTLLLYEATPRTRPAQSGNIRQYDVPTTLSLLGRLDLKRLDKAKAEGLANTIRTYMSHCIKGMSVISSNVNAP